MHIIWLKCIHTWWKLPSSSCSTSQSTWLLITFLLPQMCSTIFFFYKGSWHKGTDSVSRGVCITLPYEYAKGYSRWHLQQPRLIFAVCQHNFVDWMDCWKHPSLNVVTFVDETKHAPTTATLLMINMLIIYVMLTARKHGHIILK